MAKVDAKTLASIQGLVEQFEEELERSNYSRNTKVIRRDYLRQFIRWLDDDWSPLTYDGSMTP